MATPSTRSTTISQRTTTLSGDTLLDVTTASTSTIIVEQDAEEATRSRKRKRIQKVVQNQTSVRRTKTEVIVEEEESGGDASPLSSLSPLPAPPPKPKRKVTVTPSASTLVGFSQFEGSLQTDASIPGKPKRARKPKIDPTSLEGVDEDIVDTTRFLPRPAKGSKESEWLVGAHVSAAGGVENAPVNAAEIGCSAFALFLKSQRKWASPPLSPRSIALFKHRMTQLGFDPRTDVLVHGNYLVNLGNPDDSKRQVSYECFLDEIKRCGELAIRLLNIHPGSTVSQTTPEISCKLIADCINDAHRATARGPAADVVVVLENMAGSGNVIGSTFEEIAQIIESVEDKTRVGVCFDTCHGFSAGYDFRTKEGWDETMLKFDRVIGLKYLMGMHLNDSKTEFGSKKDRHESIGMGSLGLESFHHILNDPRTQGIPMVLETPSWERPKEVWGTEIGVLRRLNGLPLSLKDEGGVDEKEVVHAGDDDRDTIETLREEVKDAIKRVGGETAKKARGGKAAKADKGKARAAGMRSRKRKRDADDENDAEENGDGEGQQDAGEDSEGDGCCKH